MQNNFARKQKKKEFVMVLLICMVCLSAVIWGAAAFSKRDTKKDNQEDIINLNETTNEANAETDGNDGEGESVNSQVVKQTSEPETEPKATVPAETEKTEPMTTEAEYGEKVANADDTEKNSPIDNGENIDETQQANSQVANLTFNQESVLMWPVEGNVILGFNMENTIYFPTLDSYRCNPAMVIQGDIGMNVVSAAEGYIKEIGTDAEIGNYIVMSLGNDYELTYGQLKDICVNEGDYVEQAQKIASVAEPSKYYLKEGTNIYLKLTQAGTPVDPLDYLE